MSACFNWKYCFHLPSPSLPSPLPSPPFPSPLLPSPLIYMLRDWDVMAFWGQIKSLTNVAAAFILWRPMKCLTHVDSLLGRTFRSILRMVRCANPFLHVIADNTS